MKSEGGETQRGWRLRTAAVSHRGNFRKHNEDAVLTLPLPAGAMPPEGELSCGVGGDEGGLIALVCDGVGGENAGEVASQLGAQGFAQALRASLGHGEKVDWPTALADAVAQAHQRLLEHARLHPELEGMGTTLTSMVVAGSTAWLAHIGDSRLYRWRKGSLEVLTRDHSLVGQQFRDGLLSEEEVRRHPLRNILEKVLGGSAQEPSPDVEALDLQDGDLWLLCSDGLTDSLRDKDIAQVLREQKRSRAAQVSAALLQAALDTGGRDNVSVVVIEVEALSRSLFARWFS